MMGGVRGGEVEQLVSQREADDQQGDDEWEQERSVGSEGISRGEGIRGRSAVGERPFLALQRSRRRSGTVRNDEEHKGATREKDACERKGRLERGRATITEEANRVVAEAAKSADENRRITTVQRDIRAAGAVDGRGRSRGRRHRRNAAWYNSSGTAQYVRMLFRTSNP